MQIKAFINSHVETIGPDETLQTAAAKMRHLDIESILVCDGNRPVGVITDRDITFRATAEGENPTVTKVAAVMTPDVICCGENQTIEEAAKLMQDHHLRSLFVLSEDDKLVGTVSLGDLATAIDRKLAGETLERVSDSGEVVVTRITGLFDDTDQAKEAVLELKDAGLADEKIIVAMKDSDAQVGFIGNTRLHVAASEEISSLPELDSGQVLIMVDAPNLSAMALEIEIINRNHGIIGIQMPG
jgi:CBS domain-containing protein